VEVVVEVVAIIAAAVLIKGLPGTLEQPMVGMGKEKAAETVLEVVVEVVDNSAVLVAL
jgi:hypothetical protein